MKKKTFTILFYVKRTKLLKTGDAPIFMRITVDSVREEIAGMRRKKTNKFIGYFSNVLRRQSVHLFEDTICPDFLLPENKP